ncbi:MAG: hypothetical protein ABSG50_02755 [Opitutaceae bacterium]
MSSLRFILLVLGALSLASAAGPLRGTDERPTTLTTDAPVINFRVPTFTKEGYRSWLLCGSEGLYINQDQLAVTDLNLTVFTGDASNRVESVFLSPAATALLNVGQVRGPGRLRLISDDFEATGADWVYDHRQKKVSIRKDVHVVFHTQLKDILR